MKLGKHWVAHIARSDDPAAWIPVVNEIASGSACKYKLDKITGQLELARALPPDVAFPLNYGFIPHTRSDADDEETDVMIVTREPLLPLTIVRARVIGGFVETTADEGPEERLLVAAVADPSVADIQSIDDLEDDLRSRIERFVVSYKADQGVRVTFDGWLDRDEALARLRRGFKLAKKKAAK